MSNLKKYFVCLDFSCLSSLSKKIDGFKKRYDPKYRQRSFSHMSLLKPFECHPLDKYKLRDELKEELETFYYNCEPLGLSFTGVGVLKHKKANIVYLNPHFDSDLSYCQDLVIDICKAFIPQNIKYKNNDFQFLPLGYFYDDLSLIKVMTQAKLEFARNSQLFIKSISLYEEGMGQWSLVDKLIQFENVKENFLQHQL